MRTFTAKALCIGLVLLGCQPLVVRAQDSERAQLAAERQRLLDQYAAQEQAGREQFVVTACVDDVRHRRRLSLQPLRARELSLDESERAQRALERLSARAARAGAASSAASASRTAPPGMAASGPSHLGLPVPAVQSAPPGRDGAAAHAGPTTETRSMQAAERARAAARHAEALDALQAEVARKSAERALSAHKSAPLPAPASAALAASANAAGH